MQAGHELIAESSCGPARRAATPGDHEVDLTNEAPSRAAYHSAGPQVTQPSAKLGRPTPEEGESVLYKNSGEELEYLQRKNTHLEKQCKIKCLCAWLLDNNTHHYGESLEALAELLAHKPLTPVKLTTKRSTILLLDFDDHQQKDLAVFICRVENVLENDVAVYPTEEDQMMFAKRNLVIDTIALWDKYCVRHPKRDHTCAVMNELLYSWMTSTRLHTNAASQKLRLVKLGPDKTIMSFGAYIVATSEATDITLYNKHLFF